MAVLAAALTAAPALADAAPHQAPADNAPARDHPVHPGAAARRQDPAAGRQDPAARRQDPAAR